MYLEVLQKIRSNLREGNFKDLEIALDYSKPILIFLQKAIKKYDLKKEDLEKVNIPSGKNYTTFKGENGLSMVYKDTDSYNEEILLNKEITELNKRLDFEGKFKQELKSFDEFRNKKKKEGLRMQYFNDNVDKSVNNILDFIVSEKVVELYPDISKLEEVLEQVKHKCGSTTDKIVKKIKVELKEEITKERIKQWITELEESFTKLDVQQKLENKKESLFAIGFIEE